MKVKSKVTGYGLTKGQYYLVYSADSMWYKVKLSRGSWTTLAKSHFEDPDLSCTV